VVQLQTYFQAVCRFLNEVKHEWLKLQLVQVTNIRAMKGFCVTRDAFLGIFK